MEREVPLHELLENVPENARLIIDSEDQMSTSFIPVGHLCKRAAKALRKALSKREWVGLTDEEGAEIWGDAHDIDWNRLVTPKEIIKRIEAKLKEKNA